MATVNRTVNGKKLVKFLAEMDGVQFEVDDRAIEIGHRAEQLLIHHRAEGVAHIEVTKGRKRDPDAYVQLVDSNVTNKESAGANSALSIEFGREDAIDEHGNKYGGMKGLEILGRAAHLQTRGRKSKSLKGTPQRSRHKRHYGGD